MSPCHRSPEIQYALNYATLALLADTQPPPPPPGEAWLDLRRRILDLQLKPSSPIPVVHRNIGSPLFDRSSWILKYDDVFASDLVKAHSRPVNVYPAELKARARQVHARAGQEIAKWERANCEGDWFRARDLATIEEMWVSAEEISAINEQLLAYLRRFRANPDEGFKSGDMKKFLEECRYQQEKARVGKLWARERGWATAEERLAQTERSLAGIEENMVKIEQHMVKIEQGRDN